MERYGIQWYEAPFKLFTKVTSEKNCRFLRLFLLCLCLPFQPCMTQNWEININFKVSGKGKDLYGDGFAIWYARDRLVPGAVFGSKDYFMGLAIILDTYSNHNGPHNVCVTNFFLCIYHFSFSIHIH